MGEERKSSKQLLAELQAKHYADAQKAKAEGKTLDVHPEDYPHSKSTDKTVVLPFVWGNIWLNDEEKVNTAAKELQEAYIIGENTPEKQPLIHKVIGL